ncbi:MAG: dienelactone hydrolase family protein [Deltaproteobacteria bacterium]|nr:dienelactone hydrolase family protein [Deltaproteobacteria bacterium]
MTHPKHVEFSAAQGPARGLLFAPSAPKLGMIVIQEWWGLVPHIEEVARRFAVLGYTTLAPDLYRGKKTVDAEEASHLMQGLDFGRAAQEIAGAARYLRDEAGCERVGVVGFCMGGALTVLAAATGAADAYVAFYGFPPKDAAKLDAIRAPGLLHFGESEGFFSVDDARAFATAQSKRGIATEVRVHAGAGHGFFNDARPEVYHPTAAKVAWGETLGHFATHLGHVGPRQ